ncbi:hypothetical protein ETI05_08390 [Macrococcoides canis]|uniref:hypothetical protein n=1 Tax=Macrococcoides canis TaxID=1855823 RepID=UPI001061E32D|nr:hypothetical protein [Macrococcus canis]TDM20417.1 hypothetical protein ETI05_08390 [Macrococcus canis]TDM30641.1 hypothetical protein ETI03_06225 [Macrococcus canis]
MQNEVLVHVRSMVYAEWWYSARTEHGICKTALKRTYGAWYMHQHPKQHSKQKIPAHGWYSL